MKLKKGILLLFSGLFVFSLMSAAVVSNKTTQAETGVLEECLIRDIYILNETLTIPEAEITYGNEKKLATESILVYPDGRAVNRQTNVLSVAGEYSVIYSADFDGRTVKAEKPFHVKDKLYTVGNEETSSVYYGVSDRYEELADKEGIVLNLARDDVFYFNKVIDLRNKTSMDGLLTFFAAPAEKETCDAQTVTICLTDAYDAENYIVVDIKNNSQLGTWADPVVYCTANAVGQPKSGMASADWCRQDSWAGTTIVFSLAGKPAEEYNQELGEDVFTFSMDYENRAVYGENTLIMDLDDAKYLDTLWQGFTTGEAYLSISASRYISSSTQLVITDINGEALDVNEFYGAEAPRITVDFAGYEEDALPNAVVGKPYTLYDYKAETLYGNIRKEGVAVYYGYNTLSPVICNITDGKFTPLREGNYTIVYYAEDSYGHVTSREVRIKAVQAGDLSVNIVGQTAEGKLGNEIIAMQALETENSFGNIDVTITADDGNGNVYNVDTTTYGFRPHYAGIYTVTVNVSDYIDTVKKAFQIEVKSSDIPYIGEEPILPAYFIKNAGYRLPEIGAVDYITGVPVAIETELIIKEDGGNEKLLTDTEYIVKANSYVDVIYRANRNGKTTQIVRTVPVVDVGYGDSLTLAKYFAEDKGVQSIQEEDFVRVTTTQDGAQTTFINAVNANEFYLIWKMAKEYTDFSCVDFILTDTEDKEKFIQFSFVRNGSVIDFVLNNKLTYRVTDSYDINNPENLEIRYLNDNLVVYPVRDRALSVSETANGEPFTGFHKAYVTIRFSGVKENAGIDIMSMNRQSFVNIDIDIFPPQLSVPSVSGEKALGERIELSGATILDVLDPAVTAHMYVKAPDGSFVQSEDGILLNGENDVTIGYAFTVNQYGEYTVYYSAKDTSGKNVEYSYFITVVDRTPPVITLKDVKTQFKSNEKITLAQATATDDLDENLTVNVFVKYPTGAMSMIQNEFKPTTRGVYEVIYTCYDSNNNFATVSYKFEVI